MRWAKAVVAAVGAGVLAAEAFWGPDTTAGKLLVIASAVLTVFGVWAAPRPPDSPGPPGPAS